MRPCPRPANGPSIRWTSESIPTSARLARDAADRAAAVLRDAVAAKGVAHAMFATGNSQLEFVDALVTETPDVPWSDIVVFHMDEYVGVGPDHPAGFQRWIRERITDRVHPRQAHYIDGLADPDRSAAATPISWRPTPSTSAVSASGRTAISPSTIPPWPTSTTLST